MSKLVRLREALSVQLQAAHNWSEPYARSMMVAYEQFLALRAHNPTLSPTGDVDKVWHQHILDTRHYAHTVTIASASLCTTIPRTRAILRQNEQSACWQRAHGDTLCDPRCPCLNLVHAQSKCASPSIGTHRMAKSLVGMLLRPLDTQPGNFTAKTFWCLQTCTPWRRCRSTYRPASVERMCVCTCPREKHPKNRAGAFQSPPNNVSRCCRTTFLSCAISQPLREAVNSGFFF